MSKIVANSVQPVELYLYTVIRTVVKNVNNEQIIYKLFAIMFPGNVNYQEMINYKVFDHGFRDIKKSFVTYGNQSKMRLNELFSFKECIVKHDHPKCKTKVHAKFSNEEVIEFANVDKFLEYYESYSIRSKLAYLSR